MHFLNDFLNKFWLKPMEFLKYNHGLKPVPIDILLNSLVNLIKRNSETFAPNSFVAFSYSAGNNHVVFYSVWKFQDIIYSSTVKTFHRRTVVTLLRHCNYEILRG